MIVGAIRGNLIAFLLDCAPSEARLDAEAQSARRISIAAGRDGHTGPVVRAPGEASLAHASSTIIVIAGAFLGNFDASVQNRTERILRLQGNASTAVIVGSTTVWNSDALISQSAQRVSIITGSDTMSLVGGRGVSLHAVATFVVIIFLIGSFVLEAEIDLGQTGLEIVGDQVSWSTKVTNLLDKIDLLTIRNRWNAGEAVGRNKVAAGTFIADQSLRRF